MKIGITGHQNLEGEETILWLGNSIVQKIDSVNPKIGYSCLAAGADQLFASILLDRGIDLVSIIASLDYETTFRNNSAALKKYETLLKKSKRVVRLRYPVSDEIAFFNASKFMVNKIDILFAIWNNLPAKGFGGTADVVNYALEHKKVIFHLNPINKTIKTI